MCGPHSALGLDDAERMLWPQLRETLRIPGRLMALMRGVLGADAEVAVVTAVGADGLVQPIAILLTPAITAELELPAAGAGERVTARIAGDPVDVLMATVDGQGRPVALFVNPWIAANLNLYARRLWRRRDPP
jgi:hypothetical protein